jgi:hypothetical protein
MTCPVFPASREIGTAASMISRTFIGRRLLRMTCSIACFVVNFSMTSPWFG